MLTSRLTGRQPIKGNLTEQPLTSSRSLVEAEANLLPVLRLFSQTEPAWSAPAARPAESPQAI